MRCYYYVYMVVFLVLIKSIFSCEEWRRGSFNIYLVYVENIQKIYVVWKGQKEPPKRKINTPFNLLFPKCQAFS